MSKASKDKKEQVADEVVVEQSRPLVFVRPSKERRVSFEQWAKLRGKPARHLGGMKAFLGNRANSKFSVDKWDEIFKAY